MSYTLLVGDRSYSSWSLRGWLLFEKFQIPYTQQVTRLYCDDLARDLADFAPARTVPVMKTPQGAVVWDTLAMAETLADAYPQAGFWPDAPNARAFARSIVAEMHSSYSHLRSDCPMNLRHRFSDFQPSAAVRADVERIETLWALAMAHPDRQSGPWLFGRYSVADAFFAPVATRLWTYGLGAGEDANAYIQTTISDPVFEAWRAAGLSEAPQSAYDMRNTIIAW